MLSINNVGIHNLSPGMVTTDLLMAGARLRQQHVWSNMPGFPAKSLNISTGNTKHVSSAAHMECLAPIRQHS